MPLFGSRNRTLADPGGILPLGLDDEDEESILLLEIREGGKGANLSSSSLLLLLLAVVVAAAAAAVIDLGNDVVYVLIFRKPASAHKQAPLVDSVQKPHLSISDMRDDEGNKFRSSKFGSSSSSSSSCSSCCMCSCWMSP